MGDVFAGRYELVDPLGEGGTGVVWRVWDHRHQQYAAAKVLRQVDASSLLRFMREQSLRLEHPHILTPTGWAGEDDKVLFTMPIASGGSVATLISDYGPLPVRLTAELLDQLLSALEATHAQNVIHRDVKPANLLLDATGTGHPWLWLGDFGIAAGGDAPRLTQGPYTVGTPGYVAPEAFELGWQPTPAADLYAAGMCAVEMLTGAHPAPDADIATLLAAAHREEPVPDSLVAVVAQLGHATVNERYAHAGEARAELRATGLLEPLEAHRLLGDVEVFDHTPALPHGWSEHGPTEVDDADPSIAAPPMAAAPTVSTMPPPPPPQQRHEPARKMRAVALAAILMGLGVVLIAVSLFVVFG
ncbi:hypothetical protein GCM10009720_23380 [Yaniella flava]|uniref:Protein kinase domain-containing protein n=1 Tax=Yaniella flava TaxID=287930 RepID=A0ABP5G9N3_9MICC|nr:serine/threonine protein kinase [Micrococcaceae bacterium]